MFTFKILYHTLVTLFLVFSNFGSVSGEQPRLARSVCSKPVGRVVNGGDLRLGAGSEICPEDVISPINGSVVEVICRNNRTVVQIRQSKSVAQICTSRAIQSRKLCIPKPPNNCFLTRSPEGKEEPILVTPYVGRIINPRPTLNWLEVPGATSYIVQVQGYGANWSRVVQSTSLEYPLSESAMEWGQIYSINVIANEADEPVSASSSVTIVLSQEEVQEITRVVDKIKKLNLTADELAIDLDAVYMSKNLITEAIGVLKTRVDGGSTNPTIHRKLGDRYLDTGLLELNSLEAARKAYAQAIKLAQNQENEEELALAQAGIELVN